MLFCGLITSWLSEREAPPLTVLVAECFMPPPGEREPWSLLRTAGGPLDLPRPHLCPTSLSETNDTVKLPWRAYSVPVAVLRRGTAK